MCSELNSKLILIQNKSLQSKILFYFEKSYIFIIKTEEKIGSKQEISKIQFWVGCTFFCYFHVLQAFYVLIILLKKCRSPSYRNWSENVGVFLVLCLFVVLFKPYMCSRFRRASPTVMRMNMAFLWILGNLWQAFQALLQMPSEPKAAGVVISCGF